MHVGSLIATSVLLTSALFAAPTSDVAVPVTVSAKWDNVVTVSQTVPTTQHLANAFTVRTSPLNKPLLDALRDLQTNDTRLQLWYSVPNQAVPELQEPTASQTFWDFQNIDPVVVDFFANTSGTHHVNVGTIPRWMFNVPPVRVPSDPAASFYGYTGGTKGELLKDPTGKQFADYQARIFQWYTQGGFTDEIGQYHQSDYHFKIDYWGIMNESTLENKLSVQQYTLLYDAVVEAIRKIDPKVEFFGPEVFGPVIPWANYFLDPKNHSAAALPVQWFSFHNYAFGDSRPELWQDKYFLGGGASAHSLANTTEQLIKIRDKLSPNTKIAIDELGTFMVPKPGDDVAKTTEPYQAYDPLYWVATGANWACNFITAEKLGIQLISMTQMVGAPTQSESCSMINWDTGKPNAHYWVLKLINSNFGPGDKLVATESSSSDIEAQASITPLGRKVFLVNTSNRTVPVNLGKAFESLPLRIETVDEASGEQAPRSETSNGADISLAPFAVAVVSEH